MRVAIVGPGDPPSEFLRRKIAALRKAGVEVVTAARVGSFALRTLRADVIHFEWNSAAIDSLSVRAIWGRPVIVSCRGTQVRVLPYVTPGYAGRLRESFARATAVHCVCETIRDEAIALGLEPSKAEVIYPGVDLNEFQPAVRIPHDGPLRIVAVGALNWVKGYEYALSALRRLLDSGAEAHLEIIGDGNERQRIRFAAQELGLADHVTFRGNLSAQELRLSLTRADVFLHSSLSEGVSNAVLEAMATAMPVVSTDCGGMREAVTDGESGLIVPMRDPSAAAAALARLSADPALRTSMGQQAHVTVRERFTLEQQTAGFVEMYQRAVAAQARN